MSASRDATNVCLKSREHILVSVVHAQPFKTHAHRDTVLSDLCMSCLSPGGREEDLMVKTGEYPSEIPTRMAFETRT